MTEYQECFGSMDVEQLYVELEYQQSLGFGLRDSVCAYLVDRIEMLKRHGNYFRHFMYEKSTKTIRTKMSNNWVATVRDGKLVFDSWDGAIVGKIDQREVTKLWEARMLPENHV